MLVVGSAVGRYRGGNLEFKDVVPAFAGTTELE
jgi:hypothetical protein